MSVQTKVPPRERARGGSGEGLGPPWKVIVLNDNHNTFQGVAFALASVLPGVSYERGLALANRIHNLGQAVVWSGHREQAELYWEQLAGYGLTMAPLER
ncbi:MAG: ATP-dependent Clp protease adaptor ClpS [Thermoleophilia bacterium]|nr:ATP-dependent Clp protease adaptor ClpS [Gaiellaceae bacterium]MDW8338759.1 ATP-dependent Clp protease adaptor ClpS [Thermoleophilia bacterium]